MKKLLLIFIFSGFLRVTLGQDTYGGANIGNNTHEIGLGYRFGKELKNKFL